MTVRQRLRRLRDLTDSIASLLQYLSAARGLRDIRIFCGVKPCSS